MNAELGEAMALLADPDEEMGQPEQAEAFEDGHPENYWRWRYRMAEQIASHLDADRFGVAGFYLFGSTKNGTAGPASDIDVLVHFKGTNHPARGHDPMARRMEPVPRRNQLPANRIPVRRTAGCPHRYRRRHRQEDQLRRENQRGHGRSAPTEARESRAASFQKQDELSTREGVN